MIIDFWLLEFQSAEFIVLHLQLHISVMYLCIVIQLSCCLRMKELVIVTLCVRLHL